MDKASPDTVPGLKITEGAGVRILTTDTEDRGPITSITQGALDAATRRGVDLPREIEQAISQRRPRTDIPVGVRHIRIERVGDDLHVSLV